MGLEDLGKKASEFAKENADKVDEALKSEQAEQISDKILDGVAGFADKVTGGKHSDKIAEARDGLDGKIGNE
ncbi:Rv0909 family putative TA system antitoxin [Leucobacter ruminantium]|uniref:Antitoxin n=1 Tax=Leucobacter ruminantium TaxID=1289170 RepID=A0A939M0J2_9MICO|nr:Rv0909 family putative TA system antitoxin [Leucobacter ruminantium]MBO1806338.1 antitoxin [Leucobacter ruminantium]